MNHMLLGGIAVGSFIAGLFFLRYWRITRDRFFLFFAAFSFFFVITSSFGAGCWCDFNFGIIINQCHRNFFNRVQPANDHFSEATFFFFDQCVFVEQMFNGTWPVCEGVH